MMTKKVDSIFQSNFEKWTFWISISAQQIDIWNCLFTIWFSLWELFKGMTFVYLRSKISNAHKRHNKVKHDIKFSTPIFLGFGTIVTETIEALAARAKALCLQGQFGRAAKTLSSDGVAPDDIQTFRELKTLHPLDEEPRLQFQDYSSQAVWWANCIWPNRSLPQLLSCSST